MRSEREEREREREREKERKRNFKIKRTREEEEELNLSCCIPHLALHCPPTHEIKYEERKNKESHPSSCIVLILKSTPIVEM